MPAPIIVGDQSGLAEGIIGGSSSIAQALGQRRQQQQQQQKEQQEKEKQTKSMSAITEWAAGYDSTKSPIENIGSLQAVLQNQGLDPSSIQPILKSVLEKSITQQGDLFGASQLFGPPGGGAAAQQQPQVPGQAPVSPQQPQDRMAKFSAEDLVLTSANPNRIISQAAKAEIEKRKLDQSVSEADRKYHTQFASKQEEKISGLREAIPKKKTALRHARNAVESGKVGAFSINNIADAIGGTLGDTFRTAKGSQLVTAGKENLLSNMARVSAKAQNQWFEQRLASMFPKVGQTMEANLAIQEMLESELVMEDAYLKKFDQFQAEDEALYGYAKKDVDRRARQAVEHLEDLSFDRSAYRLRNLEESEMGQKGMRKNLTKKVSKGTPMTLEMGSLFMEKYKDPKVAFEMAEKLGYKVPNGEDLQLYLISNEEFSERIGSM